jgi:hypothetical protein
MTNDDHDMSEAVDKLREMVTEKDIVPCVLNPVQGSDDMRNVFLLLVKDDENNVINVNGLKLQDSDINHGASFFVVPEYTRNMMKEKYGVDLSKNVTYDDDTGGLSPVTKEQMDMFNLL